MRSLLAAWKLRQRKILQAKMRLISSQNLDEAYDQLILPLVEHGFLNSTKDRQVVLNTAFYLTNFSTSCASEVPLGVFPLQQCSSIYASAGSIVVKGTGIAPLIQFTQAENSTR